MLLLACLTIIHAVFGIFFEPYIFTGLLANLVSASLLPFSPSLPDGTLHELDDCRILVTDSSTPT
jgi:hypothetical protein